MLFSAIVPIYNAEKTLTRCLESIIVQNYLHYEVLMIDDGSVDKSAEIASEYAKKDDRFILIQQSNAGVAEARNRGLEMANGEIICFIDSDDFIEPKYFESINETFLSAYADVVFLGARRVSRSNEIVANMHVKSLPNTYEEQLVALSRADAFGYTWIKAIRKEIIGEVRFCENLKPFEDEVFTCEIMEKRPAISNIDKILYNQVVVPGSLSRRAYSDYYEKCEEVYLAWKRVLAHMQIKQHPFLQEKVNHMANVCKYYYLEKDVPPTSFVKGLTNCTFFQDATVEDSLIFAIQKRRFVFAQTVRIANRTKVFLRKVISR